MRLSRPLAFAVLFGAVALWHGWLLHTQPWWRTAARPPSAAPASLIVRQVVRQVAGPVVAVAPQAPEAPARAAAAISRPAARSQPVARATPPDSPAARAAPRAPAAETPAPVADAAPPAAEPLPLYATRLAPGIELLFRLQRGEQQGSATLSWRPDAPNARYEAQLAGEIDGRGVLHWSSRGTLDSGSGVAPERFVLREPRRGAQAANFDRSAAPPRITYSGPPVVHALPLGAQDRLSWLIQLAAVVAADPARHGAPGAVVELFVAGARGDADRWRFEALGSETLKLADGTLLDAWAYVRAPQRPYDVRIEVWLAPAQMYLPVRLRVLPTGAGRPLELLLRTAG